VQDALEEALLAARYSAALAKDRLLQSLVADLDCGRSAARLAVSGSEEYAFQRG